MMFPSKLACLCVTVTAIIALQLFFGLLSTSETIVTRDNHHTVTNGNSAAAQPRPPLKLVFRGGRCKPQAKLWATKTAPVRNCSADGYATPGNREYFELYLESMKKDDRVTQPVIDELIREGTNRTDTLVNTECMFLHRWRSGCLVFEEALFQLPNFIVSPRDNNNRHEQLLIQGGDPEHFSTSLRPVLDQLVEKWGSVPSRCVAQLNTPIHTRVAVASQISGRGSGHFFSFNNDPQNNPCRKSDELNSTSVDFRASQGDGAPANYFTRLEWLAALSSKKLKNIGGSGGGSGSGGGNHLRVRISGDSMARQFFCRMMLFLGGSTVLDSIPNIGIDFFTATYVLFVDGSVSFRATGTSSRFVDKFGSISVDGEDVGAEALFVISYHYDHSRSPKRFPANGYIDLHFHFLTYHDVHVAERHTYDAFFGAIRKRLADNTTLSPAKTVIVTLPPTNRAGNNSNASLREYYRARNIEVTTLVNAINKDFPNGRFHTFDAAGLSDVLEATTIAHGGTAATSSTGGLRCDGVHYACNMRPMAPNVGHLYSSSCPHFQHCRDDFNVLLAQMVAQVSLSFW